MDWRIRYCLFKILMCTVLALSTSLPCFSREYRRQPSIDRKESPTHTLDVLNRIQSKWSVGYPGYLRQIGPIPIEFSSVPTLIDRKQLITLDRIQEIFIQNRKENAMMSAKNDTLNKPSDGLSSMGKTVDKDQDGGHHLKESANEASRENSTDSSLAEDLKTNEVDVKKETSAGADPIPQEIGVRLYRGENEGDSETFLYYLKKSASDGKNDQETFLVPFEVPFQMTPTAPIIPSKAIYRRE